MKPNFFQRLRRPESNKSIFTFILTALIFGMIITSFIFMSPGGGGTLSGSATAATVGGRVIPILQLQQRVRILEEQSRSFLPNGSEQFQKFFQSQALNELINAEILTEVQSAEGLYVSDALLAQTIMDIPAFQEKERFQRDLYENYLANSGLSAGALEDRIKKDLRLGIIRDLFSQSFMATSAEKKIYSELADFTIKMDYADVSEATLTPQINITEQDLNTSLQDKDFLKRAKALYDSESFKYQVNDQVKAKWILVLANGSSADAYDTAKTKIEEATKDLNAKNFSEVAQKISEDPTAPQGGDLGYVERGTFDPEWDKVAFSLEVGKVSDVFKVEQGWARLLVEDKKIASAKTFENVKMQVAKNLLLQDKAKQILSELNQTLLDKPKELDIILAAKGIKWVTAPDFKLSAESIPGLGQADQVFERLLTLKSDGEVYAGVVSSEGKSYLIKRRNFDLKAEPNPQYESLVGSRQNYALGAWFEAQKEKIKIKVNPVLN